MNLNINLHETIGVSDHVKAETEIDAVIYRREFERHRTEYLKSKIESELILAFIFLQIYIECFLHQNMRKIVELEFKPPRDAIYTDWLANERRYVPAKIDNFIILFFVSVSTAIQQSASIIKDRFTKISDIRNLFIHGHKVAAWSDSDGNSGSSTAKSFLTEAQLIQSITEVNEIGSAWNDLLNSTLSQCKALKQVDGFKFSTV